VPKTPRSGPDGLRAAHLVAAARALLDAGRYRTDDAHLRRAVSTAYYAMFHSLARVCADRLATSRGVPLRPRTRRTVYRALLHNRARQRCRDERLLAAYPAVIREFAHGFAQLQTERQSADYDPTVVVENSDARRHVEHAARLIRAFENAPEADLRDFALRVLLAERGG